jgi:deferrochelatase/peroxidase EfeB
MVEVLEIQDIQGTVLRGRPNPYFGVYLVFRIEAPADAVTLIERLIPHLTSAADWEHPAEDAWINIVFSHEGLRVLGLDPAILGAFPRELQQGMAARSELLGDVGRSAPDHWVMPHAFKGFHFALHVMAASPELRDQKVALGEREVAQSKGVTLLYRLEVGMPSTKREHFGFVDGLTRPYIEGQGGEPLPGQTVSAPGEFVLGYRNAKGERAEGPGPEEFWRNGTYVSLRMLYQDVALFRKFLHDNADDPYAQELLAAQMMGRWRSGCPLHKSPTEDRPELATDPMQNNDFSYYESDPEGHITPLGSHIRRANPRDGLKDSIADPKLHLLLRRGSAYGAVLPEGVMEDDGVDRGLVLAVINAYPARQFEFVQSQWINDGDFISQGERTDPIIGRRDRADDFLVYQPRRKRICGLSEFTLTRGGEHLFLPGLGGLRWLVGHLRSRLES